MERKSFVFNLAWCEVLEGYPAEVRYEVYDAIIGYARTGKLSELKPLAAMAFAFIKLEMDNYFARYEATVEARREAGSKGGKAKQANATFAKQNKQMLRGTHLDSVSDSVCDISLGIIQDNSSSNRERSDSASAEEPENEDGKEEPDGMLALRRDRMAERETAGSVLDYYNERISAQGARLRLCQSRSAKRLGAVMARVREHGVEAVRRAVDKAVNSWFLNFEKGGGPADVDWIMKPDNFARLLEGNYDNKARDARRDSQTEAKERERQRQECQKVMKEQEDAMQTETRRFWLRVAERYGTDYPEIFRRNFTEEEFREMYACDNLRTTLDFQQWKVHRGIVGAEHADRWRIYTLANP